MDICSINYNISDVKNNDIKPIIQKMIIVDLDKRPSSNEVSNWLDAMIPKP